MELGQYKIHLQYFPIIPKMNMKGNSFWLPTNRWHQWPSLLIEGFEVEVSFNGFLPILFENSALYEYEFESLSRVSRDQKILKS